jgi:hypothetical protein
VYGFYRHLYLADVTGIIDYLCEDTCWGLGHESGFHMPDQRYFLINKILIFVDPCNRIFGNNYGSTNWNIHSDQLDILFVQQLKVPVMH